MKVIAIIQSIGILFSVGCVCGCDKLHGCDKVVQGTTTETQTCSSHHAQENVAKGADQVVDNDRVLTLVGTISIHKYGYLLRVDTERYLLKGNLPTPEDVDGRRCIVRGTIVQQQKNTDIVGAKPVQSSDTSTWVKELVGGRAQGVVGGHDIQNLIVREIVIK